MPDGSTFTKADERGARALDPLSPEALAACPAFRNAMAHIRAAAARRGPERPMFQARPRTAEEIAEARRLGAEHDAALDRIAASGVDVTSGLD